MKSEPPNIEVWTPGSLDPAVIAAAHLAVRQHQELVGTNTFSDIEDTQTDLANLETNYLAGGGNFFISTSEEGLLQGFVGLRRDSEDIATLKRLAVLPEYEGQGIGRALVDTLIDWARENGITKIRLQTGGDEQAKSRIYEKVGFKVTGTVPKELKSDEWLMELEL